MTCVFHIFQADVCKKSMELIHIVKLKFIAFFSWLSFPVNVKSWSLLSRLSEAYLAVTRGVFHRKDSKISVISSILLTQGSQDKSSYKYHLKTTLHSMLFTSATLRQMQTHIISETSLCGSFQNTVVLAHCQCGLSRRYTKGPSLVPSRPRRFRMGRHLSSMSSLLWSLG